MRAQQPVDPALRTASLAVPAQAPPGRLPQRRASASGELLPVDATSFDPALPNRLIEPRGDYVLFRPAYADPQSAGIADIAHAVYRIDAGGFSGDPTIGFEWGENGGPTRDGKFWVGLVDWAANHWEWFEGPMDGVLTLDSFEPYVSAGGELQVMVAILYREQITVLRRLQLGAPELRGTGVELDEPKLGFAVPPICAVNLPVSCDLRPVCAPVSDQGLWNAGPAFAIGDGAYNCELYRLYGPLGWDLDSPAQRVSPKYLYVAAGTVQHFPPGPEHGRYPARLATGLTNSGVCTAAAAPYDFTYDSNWSAQAVEEAMLLRPSICFELPARGPAAINGIKAVLAHQGRPVYLSTRIDPGFTSYEPDTVWNFRGPAYGMHSVLLVGYDDSRGAFLARNSWGTDWGNGGHCWIAYETLDNPDNTYVSCGFLQDEYDDAVAQHFLGTQATLPPPAHVAASDGFKADAIDVKWQPCPGATGYEVYRDTKAAPVAVLGRVTAWTDNEVNDRLAHVYWVRARHGTEYSAFSTSDLGFVRTAPQVHGVTPTYGTTGRQVRFSAEVTGNLPLRYSWSFGGGATPNASNLAAPVVVLGAGGFYPASLTVEGPSGTSTYDFTLSVGENQPPQATFVLPPPDTLPPYEFSFDAAVQSTDSDGHVVLFEWDWDNDGVWDEISAQPRVYSHTYTDIGFNDLRLRLTDDSGTATVFVPDFTLLDPDPNTPPIADFGHWPDPNIDVNEVVTFDGGRSLDPDGTLVNYEWDLDGDGAFEASGPELRVVSRSYPTNQTILVRLRVSDAEGAQDVDSAEIRVGLGATYPGWSGHAIDPDRDGRVYGGIVNSRPVVACAAASENSVFYYYPASMTPAGTADWIRETAVQDYDGSSLGFTEILGQPALVYRDIAGGLSLSRRSHENVWTKSQIYAGVAPYTSCAVAWVAGRIGVVFDSGSRLYYAQSNLYAPNAPLVWTVMQIGDTIQCDQNFDVHEFNGRTAVVFGTSTPHLVHKSPAFAYPTVDVPQVAEDWTWHYVTADMVEGRNMRLAPIDGQAAFSWVQDLEDGTYALHVSRAAGPTPTSAADWQQHTLLTSETVVTGELSTVGSLPALGFTGGSEVEFGFVHLALALDTLPDAADDWQVQEFAELEEARIYSLLSVVDKPALILRRPKGQGIFYFAQD
jgi:hypothetical protein